MFRTEKISDLSKRLKKEKETSTFLSNEHIVHLDQLVCITLMPNFSTFYLNFFAKQKIYQDEIKSLQDSISAKNQKIEDLKKDNEFFFNKFQPENEVSFLI